MPEKHGTEFTSRDRFKEAVCIDAMRVYDSCSEKCATIYTPYFARLFHFNSYIMRV
jgi:hypothetical protein